MFNTILHNSTLMGYITELLGNDINRINVYVHNSSITFHPLYMDLEKELNNVGKPVVGYIELARGLDNTMSCTIQIYVNTGSSRYVIYLDDESYIMLTAAYNNWIDLGTDLPLKLALIFMHKPRYTSSKTSDNIYLKMFNHILPIHSKSMDLSKENKIIYAKNSILKFIASGDTEFYTNLEQGFKNNINNMYMSYINNCKVDYAPLSKCLRLYGLITTGKINLNAIDYHTGNINVFRKFINGHDSDWLCNLPKLNYSPIYTYDWFKSNVIGNIDKAIPSEWLSNIYMFKYLVPIMLTNYDYHNMDTSIYSNANVYGNPNRGTYFTEYIFSGTDAPNLTNTVMVLLPNKAALPFYVTCYKLMYSTESDELITYLTIKRGITPSIVDYMLNNTPLLNKSKSGILKFDPYIDSNKSQYKDRAKISDSISIRFAIRKTSKVNDHVKITDKGLDSIFSNPKYNSIDYDDIYLNLGNNNVLYFDHTNVAINVLDYDSTTSNTYKVMEAAYMRHEPINLYNYIIAGLKWLYNRRVFINSIIDIHGEN